MASTPRAKAWNQPGGPAIRAARCISPKVPLGDPVTLLGDDAERAERQVQYGPLQAPCQRGVGVLRPHRSRGSVRSGPVLLAARVMSTARRAQRDAVEATRQCLVRSEERRVGKEC